MEDKYKAQKKYDAINTKMVALKLNLKTDKDILEWLSSKQSTQGAIKEAIRHYISK